MKSLKTEPIFPEFDDLFISLERVRERQSE